MDSTFHGDESITSTSTFSSHESNNVFSGQSIFSSQSPVIPNYLQNVEVRSMRAASSSEDIPPLSELQNNGASAIAQTTPRLQPSNAKAGSSRLDTVMMPNAQKAQDDPSTPVRNSTPTHTPASLSRLLGGHVPMISPDVSRHSSYMLGNANLLRRSINIEGASLPDHLYTRGLLGGRHSDITVIAFGQRYNLHRIILDRAPFFAMAFTEPWTESQAREIKLDPQTIDSSITQNAFDLALRRLYGCDISEEEDSEAVGLFATGCWLEMQEIIDTAIESILRRLNGENLGSIIRLVTTNYYGRAGERILASAKAMLCRDGWDMSLKYWDSIPATIAREIVAEDGFFVSGEWERWNHAKRLLDRRLKLYSLEFGFLQVNDKKQAAPKHLLQWLPRFNPSITSTSTKTDSRLAVTEEDKWYSLYTHPEIEPFCKLLDTGIHYIHLEFEHLQQIRDTKDVFGLPVVPESVILNSIYMQLELRQKVVNARDADTDLGLTVAIPTEAESRMEDNDSDDLMEFKGKGKAVGSHEEKPKHDEEGKLLESPKYYVPSADCNLVMGGATEPVVSSGSAQSGLRMASRLSNSAMDPDGPLIDELDGPAGVPSTGPADPPVNHQRPPAVACSRFPPFRFAASFPSPRLLKEKKRVYSRTVFYAGSLWNIYIQKMRSARNFQLGVYLHRAKERDLTDELSITRQPASVDERIGLLEREMLLRGEQRSHRGRGTRNKPPVLAHRSSATRQRPVEDGTLNRQSLNRQSTISNSSTLYSRSRYETSSPALQTFVSFDTDSSESDEPGLLEIAEMNISSSDNAGGESSNRQQPYLPPRIPALPPYTDSRPTIRTYFKIYSHSKAGRLLSVYESAPDQFDFSQSWGWKSSTLMLDEGLEDTDEASGARKGKANGVLRFCIVLGNL